VLGRPAPKSLSRQLMIRILAWREQIARVGDIDAGTRAALAAALAGGEESQRVDGSAPAPRPGSVLLREHNGVLHRVMVLDLGYAWNGRVFASLSAVARAITGTNWNGPRFFGLDGRAKGDGQRRSNTATALRASAQAASKRVTGPEAKTGESDEAATCTGQGDRAEGLPP